MEHILVAGATGYLGKYIAKNLVESGYQTTVLVRNSRKFHDFNIPVDHVLEAEVTNPDSLLRSCESIDVVISSVGITKQSDGLSYMDVDYQANLNLLEQAKKSGVKKFIYVSVLNGEKLQNLQICEAKEKFAYELRNSGIDYCIVRPNGFFSDMSEFYAMAKKGRVYLFGDGSFKSNPIHGDDLAKVCIDAIESVETEIKVGGPETFSHREIAEIAFEAAGKKPKISHIPEWVRSGSLKALKLLLSPRKFGPIEFFMTVMAMDMVAPEYGTHRLKDYFNELE